MATGAPSSRATFRGVAFLVSSGELSGGRRTVRHEFPQREPGVVEDLGRRGREFPVEGYVTGDDCDAQRDRLLAALEAKGPGELVHPRFGTRRACVDGFRVRESSTETRISYFSITFREAEQEAAAPVATAAGGAKLRSTAAVVLAALRQVAERAQSPGLPASGAANVATIVDAAAVGLEAALAPLVTVTQEAAALKRRVAAMRVGAVLLAARPAELLDEVVALFADVPSLPAREGVGGMLRARSFSPAGERPAASTTTREVEQAVFDVLLLATRCACVVQASVLASTADWDSYDEAVEARDAIAAALDEEAEFASDDLFGQLQQLRADLVRSVPGADSDLPRLVRYTPPTTVPSLVLTHTLYGDLALEADVVRRNSVLHPGFVIGGVELEVLSDA